MITATTLGFCLGSDRYTAVLAEGAWKVVDVHGETVCAAPCDASVIDPMEAVHALRAAVAPVRPARFDVGEPGGLNLDLRDPARKDWDDPARTAADRVVVKGVRSSKDSFVVELSDGGTFPWEMLGSEIAELRRA